MATKKPSNQVVCYEISVKIPLLHTTHTTRVQTESRNKARRMANAELKKHRDTLQKEIIDAMSVRIRKIDPRERGWHPITWR